MRPVLFRLGPFPVHGYWVFIVLGGLLSARFWWTRRERMGLRTERQFWLLLNAVILGVFAGGKLAHLAVYVPFSRPDFWEVALSSRHGFSILGDILGGVAAAALVCRLEGLSFPRLMDYLVSMAPVWDAVGRLGCLSAGCCYGRPAEGLPWAVVFTDPASVLPDRWVGVPLHPAQLYESAASLACAAVLHALVLPRVEAGAFRRGSALAAYLALYGAQRLATELYRGDVVPLALGFTRSQAVAAGYLALALLAFLLIRRSQAPSHAPRPL